MHLGHHASRHHRDTSRLLHQCVAPRARRRGRPRAPREASDGIVTYIVDRNINYTNVCVADCGFCAFYRRPKHNEGWTLSYEQIGAKIDEAKELGAVQILMQGGHNPYIPFEWYLDLLRYIKTLSSDPHPRLQPERSRFLRQDVPHGRARRHSRTDEGRPRFDSRRRRRNSRPARARSGREEKGRRRSVARDHGDRAQRRDEDVGHDDVRHRRNARRAHRASGARARSPGAHERVHGVHLLAAAAGEHADDVAHAEDGRGRLSAHRRDRAHRARQRAESAGELGDDGD